MGLNMKPLFLFYEEPDPDRWVPGDRLPRRLVRRIIRGKPQPGGVMRWFLNLKSGLDLLGVKYYLNDYRKFRNDRDQFACVIGKSNVLSHLPHQSRVIFGPGVPSHPFELKDNELGKIIKLIISCGWFREMYDRDLKVKIPTVVWPAGVDAQYWCPAKAKSRARRVLVYDKVRWDHDRYHVDLIQPVVSALENCGQEVVYIRYGDYREEEYRECLKAVDAMVFLCEHETQGFAYLQALSMGIPILAWNRRGDWRDPSMYPHRVVFGPVSSVPYFSSTCGLTFETLEEFYCILPEFLRSVSLDYFDPRSFILENFDLAEQARKYVGIVQECTGY